MSNDLATINQFAVMPVMELAGAISRYRAIIDFTRQIMKEGIDYGTIPGTEKPTLMKPGAEKLANFFGLTPVFEPVEIIKDWTGQQHGEPFFEYQYKCKLYRGDWLIAEGVGSCNSWEKKYRYRWVTEDEVPAHLHLNVLAQRKSSLVEFEFAINKRETSGKYGKPAEYWDSFETAIAAGDARKTTRKTSSGKELNAWEISSIVYRVPNEDVFSQVNTIDKMAQKRALVAAVLIGVNASEFFTQDLEDMDIEPTVIDVTPTATTPKSETKPEPPKQNGNGKKNGHVRNPQTLLAEVNAITNDHYKNEAHLNHVLGSWPDFSDDAAYKAAINSAVDHANTKEDDNIPF